MIFLILLISTMLSVYLYVTRYFDYWKIRGVVFVKPTAFIGNLAPIIKQKMAIGELLREVYEKYENEPYVGIFLLDKPCLIVRDPDLALRILNQDFMHFNKRLVILPKRTDPIGSKSLFVIHGQEWKNTRARLSPMFTGKKQKVVFDAMAEVSRRMVEKIAEGPTFEAKELAECIAVDMITDAVLGFAGTAISDPKNDSLRNLGNRLFDEGFDQSMRLILSFLVPEFIETFRLRIFPDSLYQIMRDATDLALSKKKKSGVKRGDYLDALLELKEKGPWEGNNGEWIVPDDVNMVGMLFMFFSAGYETMASGLTYCIYELAARQDIQEKLRAKLRQQTQKTEGKITYEDLNEMKFLDQYINEVLRKHPPFPFIDRYCTKDYRIPGTDIVIDKGMKLMIPMISLQNDIKYFKDPEVIIPERFEDIEGMQGKPYFPFSAGLRTCLGMRFARQVMKLSIVAFLQNYRLVIDKPVACTGGRVRMNPKRFGNTPLSDIVIKTYKWED